ncbi:TldD/PmbA family protein [Candidatus Poribacteria bacterium]|nr:TldD/PmbA family protein [Candidatus Poribacteria bacterium]
MPLDPRQVLERAIASSPAEHTVASVGIEERASTRFANNAITQNVSVREHYLSVTAAFGNRSGVASGTDLSDDGIRRLVDKAAEIARSSEPDPEYMPPAEPAVYPEPPGHAESTRSCTPDSAAETIVGAVGAARQSGVRLAGSFSRDYGRSALMNSRGLYVENESTWARYVNTAVADDSSGWATRGARDIRDIDVPKATRAAIDKATFGAEPREVPAGEYTVILEPDATADFLGCLYWSLDAKAAHEGRTALSGKEGQQIAASNVTISSLPTHPLCGRSRSVEGGVPATDVHWIENGTLKNLRYSRYWAARCGHDVTQPVNFVMAGGTTSLDEMIRSTERGILVTRFWYIRMVDPMKLLLTGMTRDGLFWIEGGEVRHGIRNLRFNESPLRVLNAIESMSPAACVGSPEVVPAIKVRDFRFTSGTSF